VIELHVPALRERAEDIPYLADAFIREFAVRFCKPLEGISPAAERALLMRAWRGNVRELRNVLERACMLAEGRVVGEDDLDAAIPASRPADHPHRRATGRRAVRQTPGKDVNFVERDRIVRALAEERGNKRAAADRLGVSRRTLYRRLERFQ
jgi:DNA-binding NtrC family response regulator